MTVPALKCHRCAMPLPDDADARRKYCDLCKADQQRASDNARAARRNAVRQIPRDGAALRRAINWRSFGGWLEVLRDTRALDDLAAARQAGVRLASFRAALAGRPVIRKSYLALCRWRGVAPTLFIKGRMGIMAQPSNSAATGQAR